MTKITSSVPNTSRAVVMSEVNWAQLERAMLDADIDDRLPQLLRELVPGDRVDSCLGPAIELAELRMGGAAIATAILSELVEHDLVAPAELPQSLVESEVFGLLETVRTLRELQWDTEQPDTLENLRQMFLAIATDLRVLLIVLVHKSYELRQLARKQARAARESSDPQTLSLALARAARAALDVFAPLASQLGIAQIKSQLEDAALFLLEPEEYLKIQSQLSGELQARADYINSVIAQAQDELAKNAIEAEVTGRPKHIYSLFSKMRRKGLSFEEIYDARAIRIITEDLPSCYAALGAMHGLWSPVQGQFADYVAKPKPNLYQSLHTAIVGPDGMTVEIQLRTREMHHFAEYGVAAHWVYKQSGKAGAQLQEKVDALRQALERAHARTPEEISTALQTEVFGEQVYVFTPGGDVLQLSRGATPVDFAYRVHSEVGHRCRGAKVNGRIVTLDCVLENGDRVEIITGKESKPNRDWLNPSSRYVSTTGARQRIRHWFRQQGKEAATEQGRLMVEAELVRLGAEARLAESIATALSYRNAMELYAALGFGDTTLHRFSARVLEQQLPEAVDLPIDVPQPARSGSAVSWEGIDDVLSQTAACCNPVPGDQVLGYITRGRGIRVHRKDCRNLAHSEPERIVPVQWGRATTTHPVPVRLQGHDRPGLLRDIAEAATFEGVSLTGTSASPSDSDGSVLIVTQLCVRDTAQLLRVLGRLQRVRGLIDVRRV